MLAEDVRLLGPGQQTWLFTAHSIRSLRVYAPVPLPQKHHEGDVVGPDGYYTHRGFVLELRNEHWV